MMTRFTQLVRSAKCGALSALMSMVVGVTAFGDINITEDLTLDADLDWRDQGVVTVSAGATVDLNGRTLAVKELACAGSIVDSAAQYQPLDYIESNGSQWINTGVVSTEKTSIEFDFTVTGDWNNHAYFCGDFSGRKGHNFTPLTPADDVTKKCIYFWGDKNLIYDKGSNMRYRFLTVPASDPEKAQAFLYDGTTDELLSSPSVSLVHNGQGEMTLFAASSAGNQASSYRLHAFRMTDTTTGKVIRDYVPVRRLSDSAIGLYDKANDKFYGSDSGVSFVAAEDERKALMQITGTLSGSGSLAGAQVKFSGDDTCWRLVANDDGFTGKVDTTGVTDPAFLLELKKFEIVYTGEHPEQKVMTICPAGDFTFEDVDDIALDVTNAAGAPISDCWLEVSGGFLKVHFADAELPAVTAEWTNEAGDGDVANPKNWICRDAAGDPIPNRLPAESTVILIGADSQFVCTNAAPLVCGKIRFEPGASLAIDCDWRGLAGVPFEGTLNLAGHKLTVSSLKGTATLTDTAHGAGFKYYRFKVNKTRGVVENPDAQKLTDNAMQVCEVKFFNDANELTYSYSNLFYEESTFNPTFIKTDNPGKALDGDFETHWYDDRASSADTALREDVWFIVEYAEPIALTHYEWYTGKNTQKYPYRQLQDWQLEGSNDRENWVLLDALNTRMNDDNDVVNKSLTYRGPAMAPTAPRGEVCIDVPAGATEMNTTVVLQGGLRLAKEGAGTFVAALDGQSYAGGTVVREGVLKPAVPVGSTSPFGLRNTSLTIEDGAQYWDDCYAPWATQYICFRLSGTGPDGTGAIRTSHVATGDINNGDVPWLAALELTGDAEIARDAYAFALCSNKRLEFPFVLNGHTLTFTSDTLTSKPNFPYLNMCSLRGAPGDTGTIVIGDNIELYPFWQNASDIPAHTLVITENATYGQAKVNLTVGTLIYRSKSKQSQTQRLTTVLESYAPVSTTSAPMVQLGAEGHLTPALDLSERTTAFDVASGGGLSFAEGSKVTVKLGNRQPRMMEKLVAWTQKPNATFTLDGHRNGGVIALDDGLFYCMSLTIIVR